MSREGAAGNESAQSAQVCATTHAPPDVTSPSAPGSPTATAISASRVDLSWSAATDDVGVTGYRVYRGDSVVEEVAATTWFDDGLIASVNYCYTVAAYDAAGDEGPRSAEARVNTPPVRLWIRQLGTASVRTVEQRSFHREGDAAARSCLGLVGGYTK